MTEAEWLAAIEPGPSANFLCTGLNLSWSSKGRRKLRLYACACCRRVWHLLDDRNRQAVEIAERYAEATALKSELDRVWKDGQHGSLGIICAQIGTAAFQAPNDIRHTVAWTAEEQNKGSYDSARTAEGRAQVELLRDIFGNPFRSVAFSSEWRTDTALSLARTMYDSRDFGAMPILADALQDAGCDNDDMLNHCRGPGPHVRGCWVVDLVLGK